MAKAQNPAPTVVLPIEDRLTPQQYEVCRCFNIPYVESLASLDDLKNAVPKFMEGNDNRDARLQEVWDIIHPPTP